MEKVRIWKEHVILPTYEIGTPEKNPVFIEKRVYQGSSGAVYPYPVIEKIYDKKVDKSYIALFLENQFVKIMVLPELGGRIQMAYDKTKQRHFVYYNQVIKPALVGLTGPWISGGIEFNWPQHHRPTTFDPVDFSIEEHEDGSATIWCSELERMFRTKGMAGFTLYPDKSYLEITAKLYNKTPFPQTFLWWANPAVKVNDSYQSVFPPDVNAVFDHGKRDVSSFPVAKGTYYKVDYAPGTDISRYKNIPVPTSYMAITSKYNFVGGYENDTKAGLLHIANHHVSPGKKQWTWGNGDFGHAWDRNLTDEDGPYIELMCGVYTDNQPDFTWLMPEEEKDFVQYFMPYRDVGVVKNATKNAMVNVEKRDDSLLVKAYTTGIYPNCTVIVQQDNKTLLKEFYMASPAYSFEQTIPFENDTMQGIKILVTDEKNNILVDWEWEAPTDNTIPEAAKPALLPSEINTNEQLFLTGLHLEQYRHATYSPIPYYKEALRRDPKDIRCNNALGLWLLKKAKFKEAESHFQTAVDTLIERNPNPYDGEPYFNLGLALKYQGKYQEAYNAFYKSTWNSAWQNPGYFHIAQLDCIQGNYQEALSHIEKSISRNTKDHKAQHLRIALLRKTGRIKQANRFVETSLNEDRFNYGVWYEKYLLSNSPDTLNQLHSLIRGNIYNYIEYALDYAAAGLYEEAISFLQAGISEGNETYPMGWYYLGWFYQLNGNSSKANEFYKKANKANPAYCFPNQVESVLALTHAIQQNPNDARAPYYLGNFWYAAKQYKDAIQCWEQSIATDHSYATVYRNLALAYFNKKEDSKKALTYLEKAFALDRKDPRILMELDQLYKRLNHDLIFRLSFLEANLELVIQRDDVYLERATIYNQLGRPQKAYTLIKNRKFHPWEGGEGKVTGQYVMSLVEMGKQKINEGDYEQALTYLEQAQYYPENLGEGKLYGAQENDIHYWIGIALSKLARNEEAGQYWQKASKGLDEPTAAIYYNDQQPDKIFYQGLANLKLGKHKAANQRFEKLINYGRKHLNDEVTIDYFAVSLPDLMIWEDDLNKRNQTHCKYLMALGYIGLKQTERAQTLLQEIINTDQSHIGAITHLKLIGTKHLLFDRTISGLKKNITIQ
ncbi:DUF5107 domain-containing protein [Sinomicrobium sp. M5D2P17]